MNAENVDRSTVDGAQLLPHPLTEQERARAFEGGNAPVDRVAALRAGTVAIPQRAVYWLAGVVLVLGGGGAVLEHFAGQPTSGAVATTTLSDNGAPLTPTPPRGVPVSSSLQAFMGLEKVNVAPAPPISLIDQHGRPWSWSNVKGEVVVLTFFSQGCNDICPVLAKEIATASLLLGPRAARVRFIVVNTDPHYTMVTSRPRAIVSNNLASLAIVQFLTGSLRSLNDTWINFGVTVTVGGNPPIIAHNDIMYFVDSNGQLRLRAIPFGNEQRDGTFHLPAGDSSRFAQGIVSTVKSLLGPR